MVYPAKDYGTSLYETFYVKSEINEVSILSKSITAKKIKNAVQVFL